MWRFHGVVVGDSDSALLHRHGLWKRCTHVDFAGVSSLYTGTLREEEAAGRFHASIAFTRETFDAAGGWPLTKRGDFYQTFLKRLAGVTTTVDPCCARPLSYLFRWGSIRSYHGQGLMRGPSDME